MAFFYDKDGIQQIQLETHMYREAKDANLSLPHFLNQKYKNADMTKGTAFQQLCASEGLSLAGDNQFGLRPATIADILDGKSSINAGPTNTGAAATPWGSQARSLFPAALIQLIEDAIQPDRETDDAIFRQMVAINMPIAGDSFYQPVLSYAGANGANATTNQARAARVVELGQVPTMLTLTTADRTRTIATYGIGIEMSDKAMKATTLDLLGLTVGRFLQIEKDQRVYTYLSNLFSGDLDHNTGAVTPLTTVALDSTGASGTVTHKAWLKYLANNRKKRVITHCIADIDTYMKVEGRTGRPGSNSYDPTLARIDPQAMAMNVSFGNNVKWMIVDAATAGGPVPANTVWGLDAKQAIMTVSNTEAQYQATEQFVLRRSNSLVIHFSEDAYRLYGDTELSPFESLTVS